MIDGNQKQEVAATNDQATTVNPIANANGGWSGGSGAVVSSMPFVDDDDDDDDDDENNNDMYCTLPPVVSSANSGKMAPRTKFWLAMQLIDVFSIIMGSLCFIVGSILFFPNYGGDCSSVGVDNCVLIGADLFIIGSYLFLQGTTIVFFQSGAYKFENIPLVVNLAMYLVANAMFVVGSFFFIPNVMTQYGPFIGVWLFIIGSLIFVISPAYNLYRATGMRQQRKMSKSQYRITSVMCVLYILGSSAFVVGSVFFLPKYFEGFAVSIFVWGSVCFLMATLLAPLKYSWNVTSNARQSISASVSRFSLGDGDGNVTRAGSKIGESLL